MLSFTVGRSAITIFLDGQINTVDSTHPNFQPLAAELRKRAEERDLTLVRSLSTVRKMLEAKIIGNVGINPDGVITYRDEPVNNYMTQRMIQILSEGYDITPWANFMDNVMSNPAKYAHDELYEWMEKADMPITEDGCLIAFKKVRSDYTDNYTGKFDNSVGSLLEMDRAACNPDRDQTCSTGFHFCSAGYLSSFGGERVMVVKVNPRDVTSIPSDYKFTKGRCCRYEVIGELDSQSDAYRQAWKKGVVTFEDDQELPDVEFSQAPKPILTLPPMQPQDQRPKAALKPLVTEKRIDASLIPSAQQLKEALRGSAKVVVTKHDGQTFGDSKRSDVVAALASNESIRAAARSLGIAESTLRGWKKVIDSTTQALTEEEMGRAVAATRQEEGRAKAATIKVIKPSGGGTGAGVLDKRYVFTTTGGRTFTVPQIEEAFLIHRGARPAARHLGVGESTLRGWRNSQSYKDYYEFQQG